MWWYHKSNKSILITSFWEQFLHSKCKFLVETNFIKKILQSFGNAMSNQNFAIIFVGFDTRKKHFRLVSDFFFVLNFI